MYTKIIHRKYRREKIVLLLIVLLLLMLFFWYIYRYYEPLFYAKTDYIPLIKDAAQRHSIDPNLLKAVIWQESRFQPNIRGRHREIGLMQVRPEHGAASDWMREHNVKLSCEGVLFRPDLNIEIGSWYLSRALKRWEGYKYQYELALSEYNAGYTGMQPWIPKKKDGEVIEHITIPSTKAYIEKIMGKYREYSTLEEKE